MVTEKAISAVIVATRPQLRNDADRVVFALHSCFLSSGYVLNATGAPAFADNALASTTSDEVGMQGWNESDDYYAFVYGKHEKGCKKVLVKCLVVNDKLMVDVLKDGTSDPHHLEITIGDFIGDSNSTNYLLQYKNLGKLVKKVNKEFLTKMDGSSTSSLFKPNSLGMTGGFRDDRNEPNVRVPEPTPLQDPCHPPWITPPVYPDLGHGDLYPFDMFPSRGVLTLGARFDPYGPPDVPGFYLNRIRFAGGLTPPPPPNNLEQIGDNFDYKQRL